MNTKIENYANNYYKLCLASDDDELTKIIFENWLLFIDKVIHSPEYKVTPAERVSRDIPSGMPVAVCMASVGEAKLAMLELSWMHPALLFRFGNFDEQPYKTEDSKIDFVKSILRKIPGIKINEYEIAEPISVNDPNRVPNTNYVDYIAVIKK